MMENVIFHACAALELHGMSQPKLAPFNAVVITTAMASSARVICCCFCPGLAFRATFLVCLKTQTERPSLVLEHCGNIFAKK